jgi:hypothetical protein
MIYIAYGCPWVYHQGKLSLPNKHVLAVLPAMDIGIIIWVPMPMPWLVNDKSKSPVQWQDLCSHPVQWQDLCSYLCNDKTCAVTRASHLCSYGRQGQGRNVKMWGEITLTGSNLVGRNCTFTTHFIEVLQYLLKTLIFAYLVRTLTLCVRMSHLPVLNSWHCCNRHHHYHHHV